MKNTTPFGLAGTAALAVILVGLSTPFQAQNATASSTSVLNTRTHALTLRLIPQWDDVMEADLQARLDAVSAGEKPKTHVTEGHIKGRGTISENHLLLEVSDDDQISISVTDANGKFVPRSVDPNLMDHLMPAFDRCHSHGASSKLPVSFFTTIDMSSPGILSGGYRVTCTPGNASQRAALTVADEIEGMRISTEIPVSSRRGSISGMKGRELREKYIIGKNLSDEEKSDAWKRISAEATAWQTTVVYPQ